MKKKSYLCNKNENYADDEIFKSLKQMLIGQKGCSIVIYQRHGIIFTDTYTLHII